MCLAPQQRALFRQVNFHKRSLLAFSRANVLRITTVCNFSSLIWPWLRTRRFSEPTSRPCGATKHGKNTAARHFYFFAHLHLLSSNFFSPLICSLLFFSSLALSTSASPSVHIVGSLTSELPSISSYPFLLRVCQEVLVSLSVF